MSNGHKHFFFPRQRWTFSFTITKLLLCFVPGLQPSSYFYFAVQLTQEHNMFLVNLGTQKPCDLLIRLEKSLQSSRCAFRKLEEDIDWPGNMGPGYGAACIYLVSDNKIIKQHKCTLLIKYTNNQTGFGWTLQKKISMLSVCVFMVNKVILLSRPSKRLLSAAAARGLITAHSQTTLSRTASVYLYTHSNAHTHTHTHPLAGKEKHLK